MKYYIYGAGGHGKVVLDALKKSGMACEGFIDDNKFLSTSNFSVFSESQIKNQEIKKIHLAIGSCSDRERISMNWDSNSFFSVYHPDASIALDVKIGIGTFIAANSVVSPDTQIGMHCIINHHVTLDHDSILGNFSHLAPHSVISGGVNIGQGVLIGSGAIVLPGISISDYAVIGAGAVVTKNVGKNVKVAGNPARPL